MEGDRPRPAEAGLRVVLVVLVAVLLIGGIGVATRSGVDLPGFGATPDCVVQTEQGEIELTIDQAQRATTAVVAAAQGDDTPEVADLDPVVLQRLADGPAGDAGPSLSCRPSELGDLAQQELTATGLTPRAQRVKESMAEVFGDQSLGGFAPGGVQRPEESTHNDGRAIDVFYLPVTQESRREGWLLAHWLVAHAEDLDIQYVIFDDRFWYSAGRRGNWRDYDAPAPANETLRHLDHVHVDVWRGD